MISESFFEKKLAHERDYWRRRHMETDYIKGIIMDLQIASQMMAVEPKYVLKDTLVRRSRKGD